MNSLTLSVRTMSSIEIAELTSKRHDHVMRDIKKMLDELRLGVPKFGGTYQDCQGKDRPLFNLPKRECLILVSGYNVELRAKIVDRWQELEAQTESKALNPTQMSRLQLLELAMQAEQERLALEHKVEEMKPTIQAYHRLANSEGMLCITDAAKELQVNSQWLHQFMAEHKWIYRRTPKGKWIGQQYQIDSGRLAHKAFEYLDSKGNEQVSYQVFVTHKGLALLSKMLSESAWEAKYV